MKRTIKIINGERWISGSLCPTHGGLSLQWISMDDPSRRFHQKFEAYQSIDPVTHERKWVMGSLDGKKPNEH